MGHRVVLLCARGQELVHVERGLLDHDWTSPYVLAPWDAEVGPQPSAPALVSKVGTALRLVRDGGQLGVWVSHATRACVDLANDFTPDV